MWYTQIHVGKIAIHTHTQIKSKIKDVVMILAGTCVIGMRKHVSQ